MSEKLLLERWRRLDVTARDLPLALVFVVGSLLPSSQGHGTQVGNLPARPFDALAVVVVLIVAGGVIGFDLAAKSIPDGYTLLLANGAGLTINPHVYIKLPYEVKEFQPITQITSGGYFMVVPISLPNR